MPRSGGWSWQNALEEFIFMNNAYEIFTAVPRKHNCAQAVAAGFGNDALADELKTCGGGNAPFGHCGALHAALSLTAAEHHEKLIAEFTAAAGAATCKEIKTAADPYPCSECVRKAAELVEKYS